jgi:DNA-binding MarR family transcriptional regulator
MSKTKAYSPAVVDTECFCLNLKRAARAIARRYDDALQPFDLTSGQFSTLVAISGLQPVSMQALAEVLVMDRTTLTATLKPLERRGLVRVAIDTADRRGRQLRVTDAGAALANETLPIWQQLQQRITRDIGASAATTLRSQLAHLV